jgi:hypothetical protein
VLNTVGRDKHIRNSKNILNSSFTFPILSKLYNGYKPSQIAAQLGLTPQGINYHTNNLVNINLIYKDTKNGIRWKLTEKGLFVLKQKYTGSVNSFNNYQTKPVARLIPTRLDNLSVEFKILGPMPSDSNLNWSRIKNGVSKHCRKYSDYTIELVRSERGKDGSAMLVHLSEKYCFDWTKELINLYNLATKYAREAATQFAIEISDYGRLIKRPHIAFEEDLIANFIATSNTGEIKTRKGESEGEGDYKAWVDSSNGNGELETNDTDYAYDYLMMPKTIKEIVDVVMKALMLIDAEHERHYHPSLTRNN